MLWRLSRWVKTKPKLNARVHLQRIWHLYQDPRCGHVSGLGVPPFGFGADRPIVNRQLEWESRGAHHNLGVGATASGIAITMPQIERHEIGPRRTIDPV